MRDRVDSYFGGLDCLACLLMPAPPLVSRLHRSSAARTLTGFKSAAARARTATRAARQSIRLIFDAYFGALRGSGAHRALRPRLSPANPRSHQCTRARLVQNQTLTDQYSQDVGFLITRPILPDDPNGAALKLAVDLRDREQVAVRLLPRGPAVRPCSAMSSHCRLRGR